MFVQSVTPSPSRTTMPIRRFLFAPILALLMIAVQGIGLPSNAWAKDATVAIDNFTFEPQVLTVKAGTTVTWTNRDDIPHSVIDKDRKLLHSKVMDTDESFSFTFVEPGDYDYFCGLHPHMTARITVAP
jgi:plastocyanin